jgi:glutamyl-tRNA synthetase
MEDLDRARVVRGSAEAILEDLHWLGLDWDEGPGTGGLYAPYAQSERMAGYEAAFARLRAAGLVYPCFCSRKDIRSAASAPQAPGDEAHYPGTCRDLSPDDVARKTEAGTIPAWRFRVGPSPAFEFEDLVRGRFEAAPGSIGDFVVRRADGVPADPAAASLPRVRSGAARVRPRAAPSRRRRRASFEAAPRRHSVRDA